jgi:hypothetical protein
MRTGHLDKNRKKRYENRWSTCSQVASLYHLRWFLSEHVFSFWRLVSFLVAFVRTLVPRLQVCIVFVGFVQVRAQHYVIKFVSDLR